jgi:hypothetical protein
MSFCPYGDIEKSDNEKNEITGIEKSDNEKFNDKKISETKNNININEKYDAEKSNNIINHEKINIVNKEIINFKRNDIQHSIINNIPAEENLHVIAVISNPCNYSRRVKLTKEFLVRMENTDNVIVYLVELVYENKTIDGNETLDGNKTIDNFQQYSIAEENNPRHLRLRTKYPIWHKENMINIGVKKLLPANWKAMAWIDADVEFDNIHWPIDTLKILNGSHDIVQLFSHAIDMDADENIMINVVSFGFQYSRNKFSTETKTPNYGHCGYAWAINRTAYDKMGGLYELGIVGAGDHHMMMALMNAGQRSVDGRCPAGYLNSVLEFQNKVKHFRIGHIPGTIKHYYHGSKVNRRYHERWAILIKHQYDPSMLRHDENGILIPANNCPAGLLADIYEYFIERKEDN